MRNFYFTYGTASQFPFRRGWSVVIAPDGIAAAHIFREYHPNPNGSNILNCAWSYSEEAFMKTEMAEGNIPMEYCHEVIGPLNDCLAYKQQYPQFFRN